MRWQRPQASFLAWLDMRELELGPDPAAVLIERARIANQHRQPAHPPLRRSSDRGHRRRTGRTAAVPPPSQVTSGHQHR
ncbi:hypothetical protein CFN78_00050 [Amycolatopsis antarctica]|uniref:Uncharacterized protein n=1 Tax=Amycolatopsis antarctica TaxID=1854586 RepID=A0A263D853_9PSEU|nr:hypothetical protein CFN78_00050 [Amycolatopsis antarctica]